MLSVIDDLKYYVLRYKNELVEGCLPNKVHLALIDHERARRELGQNKFESSRRLDEIEKSPEYKVGEFATKFLILRIPYSRDRETKARRLFLSPEEVDQNRLAIKEYLGEK